ncbi:MAG: MmcQ-like protein [Pseudonocardiales bacterium]|nr:MmcQ-like protein [Pseudonocardiales bacterium]
MNRADAFGVALDLADATKTYPFGEQTAVFKVAGKVFALAREEGDPEGITLKCEPDFAVALVRDHEAITPGYHMNKRHWITVVLDGTVPPDLIRDLIEGSYELVAPSPRRLVRAAPRARESGAAGQ